MRGRDGTGGTKHTLKTAAQPAYAAHWAAAGHRHHHHTMRLDKLTTKFQEALADAQSLALGNDHAYIQPEHLLAAMLRQEDGPKALLARAGINTGRLA